MGLKSITLCPCMTYRNFTMLLATFDWMATATFFLVVLGSFVFSEIQIDFNSMISQVTQTTSIGLLLTAFSASLYFYAQKRNMPGVLSWIIITFFLVLMHVLKYVYFYYYTDNLEYQVDYTTFVIAMILLGFKCYEMLVALAYVIETGWNFVPVAGVGANVRA